ncbi:MAG: Flp pilus assembly protein CpaB [Pseudomonadota bacterium]
MNLTILFVAVATGACAFYGTQLYLSRRAEGLERDYQARYATRPVVVAARSLSRGERLDAGSMSLRMMPVKFLSSGSLSAVAATELQGRRLARDLARGDPIELAALQARHAHGLSQILTPGLRAITFGVDEINSFAGLLTTGDFIDLYYSSERAGGQTRLVLLLQSVPVIATGERLSTETRTDSSGAQTRGSFDTVTLQVSPDDAARIVLAQRSGQVTAVLRNPDDPTKTNLSIRDSRALLSGARAQTSSPAATLAERYIPLIVGGNGGPIATIERLSVVSHDGAGASGALP